MIGLIILLAIGAVTLISLQRFYRRTMEDVTSPKVTARLKKLWDYVEQALKKQRFGAAERALLSILRIDHKSTAAYNKLGILYAMQQNYEDAIECFDIASSLTPTVNTLYNLGLVNYEYGNYEQAATALEKVIDLEPNSKRYIAYAKALQKLGHHKRVVDVLEKAADELPTKRHLELLAQAYERIENHTKSDEVRAKIALTQSKSRSP